MDELRNNPQIIELLETLEQNSMQKEKDEVSGLVSYIGDMEHTLSAMLADKLRYNRIKDSVKADLDYLSGKIPAKDTPMPVKDNVR